MKIREDIYSTELYKRLMVYIEQLDFVTIEIQDQLKTSSAIREKWFSWHNDWKKAWLTGNPEEEEIRILRKIVAITGRK